MATNDEQCTDQEAKEALTPSRKMLRETFDSADTNRDGYVTRKEMVKFMKQRGVKISRTRSLKSLLKPKKLSFEKFCAEVESRGSSGAEDVVLREKAKPNKETPIHRCRSHISKAEHYREIFRFLDENGDGTITAAEIRDRLALTGTLLTDEQIDKMIDMADTNNDRLIDYGEFTKLMNRLTLQKSRSRQSSKTSDEEELGGSVLNFLNIPESTNYNTDDLTSLRSQDFQEIQDKKSTTNSFVELDSSKL